MDTVLVLRHLTEITVFDEAHECIFFGLATDSGDKLLDDMSSFGILAHFLEVTDLREDRRSICCIREVD